MNKMIKAIVDYFTEGGIINIVAKVLLILAVTVMFAVVFCYAKKRNLEIFVSLVCAAMVVLFAFSFVDIPNYQVLVIVVLITVIVSSLLLFAQDFRRDLFRKSHKRKLAEQSGGEALSREDLQTSVEEIIKACQRLSKTDTGALILVADNISDNILDSGTYVNAKITSDLLRTLFFPKTPLHDGAVVIMHNKVVAAGCYLPLTQEDIYPREFGTRHRAAIGVTEAFPSLTAIVVSEETGIISAMHDRKIKRYLDAEQLREILYCAVGLSDEGEEERIWGWTIDEKA
ncbi:MAG: DNA integrity scanning protein DisA nucleotide-binding domain protein [Corallococcus sp.]|nr:DNA integrity scanning protein DisA nucleotide-binding domain protein [Corallococcus sp.]MCM1359123.1 DNA integrity scanning protein DisA nucleotide-binding domain protein [Corallococcus sp.]MCM1394513.1 DNA integrity scanning protein DisA nucleotide-binding domain protein [Corallococcus sp.]